MEVYFILCHPYAGYGESFVWGIYHTYKNAKKAFDELAVTYNLDINNYAAYNFNEPDMSNRYEKFEIDSYFFED